MTDKVPFTHFAKAQYDFATKLPLLANENAFLADLAVRYGRFFALLLLVSFYTLYTKNCFFLHTFHYFELLNSLAKIQKKPLHRASFAY
jgi:hypothetical protein